VHNSQLVDILVEFVGGNVWAIIKNRLLQQQSTFYTGTNAALRDGDHNKATRMSAKAEGINEIIIVVEKLPKDANEGRLDHG